MSHRNRQGRDYAAGELLRLLREDAGYSRRELADKIRRHNPDPRMHVSDRTMARVEDDGVIPTARVKFALAAEHDRLPSDIWSSAGRVVVAR